MHPDWLPEDSTLVALGNLVLLGLLVLLFMRWEQSRARAKHATRKWLATRRHARGLQNALNVTVNQYRSLRHKFSRGPRGVSLTPPLVQLQDKPRFIAPPPLDLAPAEGEDPSSWADSGVRSESFPQPETLRPDDTQTRPFPHPEAELLQRQSRPEIRQRRPPRSPRSPKKNG